MHKTKWIAITIISIVLTIIIIKGIRIFQVKKHIKVEQNAGLLYQQANALRSQGKWQESIQLYNEIIEKYPGFSEAIEVRFLAANTYRHKLLKIPEAAKLYEEILQAKHQDKLGQRIPDTLIELSGIYRYQKKNQEAIELLKKSLTEYPMLINKEWVYFQLQMLYEEIGEREKAQEMFLKRQKK